MMLWYGHGLGGWGYAGMAIGMVLFWALVVAGIVVLVRLASGDQTGHYLPSSEQPSAAELLAMRFARGEIGEKEYREMLAVLRERGAHEPVHPS